MKSALRLQDHVCPHPARRHCSWLEEIATPDEPPLEVIAERLIGGGAERCAEKLAEEIRALRPTHVSCFLGMLRIEPKGIPKDMERFGSVVMPCLAREFDDLARVGAAEPRVSASTVAH